MKNTQVTNICKKCGKPFKVKAYRSETAHYCSKACWSTRNPPQPKICKWCGNEFNSRDKRSKFCSRICASAWRSKNLVGDKAPAWKGGSSLTRKRSGLKGELKKWRIAVYKRDDYKCQKCGQVGGKLHAHHIKEFAKHPELALDVSNGITLCITCHEKEHGRKLSTPAFFPKHCESCGAKTSGRSRYCRACSIRHSWTEGGHLRSNKTGKIPNT
jgi:hypothetical protein